MIHPPQKDTSVRYRRYEDDLRSEATSRSKSPRTITSAISCCFIDLKGECFREWQHSNLIPALFIILEITLCVAIIFSFHSDTDSKAFKIGDDAVEYFFTAYMAIGIFGMVYCFAKRHKKSFVISVDNQEKSSKYLIAGVYAFGGGSLFIIMFTIFSLVDCPEQPSHYVFNIFRFFFTLCQMFFLQKFSSASFCKSISIVLLLFHLLGTNICMWIYFLIEETKLLPSTYQDILHENCTKKDKVTAKLQDFDEIAIPFTLEFCIISAGLIHAMVSYMQFFPKQQERALENIPYKSFDEAMSTTSSLVTENSTLRKANLPANQRLYAGSYPGFLIGLAVGVIMAVSEMVLDQQGKVTKNMAFHHCMMILVYISQIIALVLVTRSLKTHVCKEKRYKADEILLIVSYVGIVLWNLLCMVGAASGLSKERWIDIKEENPAIWRAVSVTIFLDSIVNIIQTSTQAFVLIRTLKFRNELREDRKLYMNRVDINKIMCRLHQALAYLLMTNVAFWALDSIFEIHKSKLYYPVVDKYFKNHWSLFSSILFPFNVFFRFHSSALLYEIISRFVYYPNSRIVDDSGGATFIIIRKRSLPTPVDSSMIDREEEKFPRPTDIFNSHWVTSRQQSIDPL